MEKIRFIKKLIGGSVLWISSLALGQMPTESFTTTAPRSFPSDYWKYSEVPLVGQLIPVNQINLQKGIHLFDVEGVVKRWEGMVNPFDSMGSGSFATSNQEQLLRLRYAYGLTRYTYVGATLGFASRWEAELYDDSGLADPEIFAGHHIPWQKGDVRLAITFSPSFGASKVERTIGDTESARGNFLRGGWSLRPEGAVTMRAGKVLLGGEASFLYFGERTQDETVNVAAQYLNDPLTIEGLNQNYLNTDSSGYGYSNATTSGSFFSTTNSIKSTVTGGHTWAVKALMEFPDWYRLGGELVYGQVGSSTRENNLGRRVESAGGSFQEVRVYGRYRYSDQLSVTPVVSWMPNLPEYRGQERLESTSNVWGLQLTVRSKFDL